MMRSKRRAALAVLLAGASLSAACGGGDQGSSASSASGGGNASTGTGAAGGGGIASECPAPSQPPVLLAAAQKAIDDTGGRRNALYKALFGLAPDGTLEAGGLDDIDWDPSHDSVYFHSTDVERNVPLLLSNDAAGAPKSAHVSLAFAAETGSFRYAVLGANAPSDLALAPPAAGSAAARMESFTLRLVKWLTGKDPGDGTGMKIVLAHLADTYWFKHDEGTAAFFSTHLPKATLNAEDTCEGTALAGCINGASLLVISDEDGNDDDDHKVPADADAVMAALDAARSAGTPVLYLQYDGSVTPLGERMMRFFRTTTTDNYWDQERLVGFSPKVLLGQNDELGDLGRLVTTLATDSLAVGDYQACIDQESQFADCAAPVYSDKVGRGAAALHTALRALDEGAVNPFTEDGYGLLRTLIQLGDAYRAEKVAYPVPVATDGAAFARAVFADSSVHYTERCARPQGDLGTYVCERADVLKKACAPLDYAKVERVSGSVDAVFLPDTEWTSTGFYALPGVPLDVVRDDAEKGNVALRFGFQREGTTRSLETDSDGSRYDRPAYLASPWISLEPGHKHTLTSPYGGPIYISLQGTTALAGHKATLSFSGVARHPALLDVGDAAAAASFVANLSTNPLPHVDLRGPGFEVHLRKDHLLHGVSAPYGLAPRKDGTQVMVDYKGDVSLLLADFRDNYLAPEYAMAGFAPPGKTLDETLSADVKAVCASLGWSCTDPAIHVRSSIQHANYDQYAACGDGCSGNPFDADWSIMPLGWGESHELGHNLQMSVLQVGYVTDADRNDWTHYATRATENSNNIFPYHNLWRYLRKVRGEKATITDDHMNLKTLFAMVQSSRAGLTRMINGQSRRVVFDDTCKLVGDYPLNAADTHAEAIWQDGGYAATNGPRMGFYLQLPLRLQGAKVSGGTVLHDGFDVFTLLYASARLFVDAAGDDAKWMAARTALGFGSFPRTGDPTYGGQEVGAITGNDYLLVSLSYLSGLDFRPYFNDMGVRYSDLASSQVALHVASGHVVGAVPSTLYVLETDLPDEDLSTVVTVAADGVAKWPRDGFHPSSCP